MDSERLVRDVIAVLAGGLSAGGPDPATRILVDQIAAALARNPWGGGVVQGFLQDPANPNRRDMLAAALRELATADPAFAQLLIDALRGRQQLTPPPAMPGTTTVNAGRDLRFGDAVNIGSGTLTVDRSRKRTIKIGLGALAVLLVAGGTTTGIILTQGGDSTTSLLPNTTGVPNAVGLALLIVPAPPPKLTSTDDNAAEVDLDHGRAGVINFSTGNSSNTSLSEGSVLAYDGYNFGVIPPAKAGVAPNDSVPDAVSCQSDALANNFGDNIHAVVRSLRLSELLHQAFCLYPTRGGKTAYVRIESLTPDTNGGTSITLGYKTY